MSSIDGFLFNAPAPPVLNALLPVQPASGSRDPARRATQQPVTTTTLIKGEIRGQLETRADLLRRGFLSEGGTMNRNLSAMNTYLSLQVDQEREEISRMMGVDDYA